MLTSVYPNYPFGIVSDLQKKKWREKIEAYIKKYHISRKQDWYRLSAFLDVRLTSLLRYVYPKVRWSKRLLQNKNKKTTQWLLFTIFKIDILPQYHMIEEYRHPVVRPMVFDIYIPGLDLAIEYQGQQHFNEIPQYFNYVDAYKASDQSKLMISSDHSISLFYVPYWWNLSASSLYVSIFPDFFQSLCAARNVE